MQILLIYIALGAFVGVYAGLLGVGGGVIIVPILDITFALTDVEFSVAHHLALGTSMGSIMFTSLSSGRSHARRGAVDWAIVKAMTPGLFTGTLAGSFVVAQIPTLHLKIIFAVFLLYSAFQIFFNVRPKSAWAQPGKAVFFAAGALVGLVSSFIGIGGGSLSIPFMVLCSVPLLRAIGTSAVLGFPIALAGTIGFVLNGWGNPQLPEHSLGYVYLPALAGMAFVAMLTAPLGVRLAHFLPIGILRKGFALLLLFFSLRMLWSVLA